METVVRETARIRETRLLIMEAFGVAGFDGRMRLTVRTGNEEAVGRFLPALSLPLRKYCMKTSM